jgi:hypothetical protein
MSHRSYQHSRRSFLRGATALGLTLPLLERIEARAEGLAPPPRFLVIQRAVGTVREQWLPSGTPSQTAASNLMLNTGAGTRAARAVGGVTAAFAPLKAKTTIIEGLDVTSAGPGGGGAHTHEGGMVAIMTGQPTTRKVGQEDHKAGGASIDQIFFEKSPLLKGTPTDSLYLGTDARADRNEVAPRVLSYRAPPAGAQPASGALAPDAIPLYPEIEPSEVYTRIIGDLMPGQPGLTPEQIAQLRAERKSIIDYLRGDLSRLSTLVPASEKTLIDAHVEALKSLETSFNSAIDALGGTSNCDALMPPMYYGVADAPANQAGQKPFHGVIGQLQLDIIRTAFACNLTRTATFMWSPGTNLVVFGGLYDGMPQEEHHLQSHSNAEGKEHDLVAIERWYADQTAAALVKFDEVLEADGSTLLDNTAVAYVTEVARGFDHDQANVPFAVIGGKNLGIPGDRFYKADGPSRPTNDLWLALAPAFEVDLPTLGAQEQSSGPLPNFLAS